MKKLKTSPIDTLHREITEANPTLPKRRSRDNWIETLLAAMQAIGKPQGTCNLDLALAATEDDLEAIAKKFGSMSKARAELLKTKPSKDAKKDGAKEPATALTAALMQVIDALEAGAPLNDAQRSKLEHLSELLKAKPPEES